MEPGTSTNDGCFDRQNIRWQRVAHMKNTISYRKSLGLRLNRLYSPGPGRISIRGECTGRCRPHIWIRRADHKEKNQDRPYLGEDKTLTKYSVTYVIYVYICYICYMWYIMLYPLYVTPILHMMTSVSDTVVAKRLGASTSKNSLNHSHRIPRRYNWIRQPPKRNHDSHRKSKPWRYTRGRKRWRWPRPRVQATCRTSRHLQRTGSILRHKKESVTDEGRPKIFWYIPINIL